MCSGPQKKTIEEGKERKKKKASIFTSENWHFKDSAKTGYYTFEALSKEQLKFFAISLLAAKSGIDLKVALAHEQPSRSS